MTALVTFLVLAAAVVVGNLVSSAIQTWKAHRDWQRAESEAKMEAVKMMHDMQQQLDTHTQEQRRKVRAN